MRVAVLLSLLPLWFVTASASAAATAAPFLWEVRGPSTTHYLLGSVHLLPEASARWPSGIADAYDAADGLIFEADIGQLGSPQTGLALLAAAKSPKGLRGEIGDATYDLLGRKLKDASLPPQLCDAYKPWFCALSIEIAEYKKAGFSGDYGLDRQIYDAGRTDGKNVHGLETVAQQISLFVDMPPTLSKQFLDAELADGDGLESPAAVYRAWKDNDVDAVAANAAYLKARFPQVYARLLADRNRAWLPRLKPWLDGDRPQLVVVGAAHLVGPEGLVAQLRARGYRVLPYLGADPQLLTRQLPPVTILAQRGAAPAAAIAAVR